MFPFAIAAVVLFFSSVDLASPAPAVGAATPVPVVCPVTLPNGSTPPGESPGPGHHGDGELWTGLPLDGRYQVLQSDITPSGWIGIKFWWWRAVYGELTLETRYLDGPSRAARPHVPEGYGETGFQATGIVFPQPGCWEVTGRVGESSLTVVILIEIVTDEEVAPATPEASPRPG